MDQQQQQQQQLQQQLHQQQQLQQQQQFKQQQQFQQQQQQQLQQQQQNLPPGYQQQTSEYNRTIDQSTGSQQTGDQNQSYLTYVLSSIFCCHFLFIFPFY
jgi:hypothetical protein